MPRACTVCACSERAAIDRQLATGEAVNRRIAAQHGLTEASIRRHASHHLSASLVEAAGLEKAKQALDVLAQLKAVNGACLHILSAAMNGPNHELALRAVDRVTRQLELQAKLSGDIDDRPQVNVTISAEWVSLRVRILTALTPYPDAKTALIEALDVE